MNYRTPTISQDNFALHRALIRRDELNAEAALRKMKWQARRRSIEGILVTFRGYLKLAATQITTRRVAVSKLRQATSMNPINPNQ